MRKACEDISGIKERIEKLKGENVCLAINRGRKKIEKLPATIESIYPSVFTARVETLKQKVIQTFSYSDVLCGDVKIIGK